MEPFEKSVNQVATEIRRGELSPITLMEAILKRIRNLEPFLKSWVTLDSEMALEFAHQAERALQSGAPIGVLHGVPIGVKDIFFTEGVRTTAGSPIHANFIPTYDATAVSKLKAEGAIILGKTVTTQFAFADPSPTVNPWNAAHTPGGSSSGSAAAVAARMCPAALGSQTVGSTLRPASYNGIVGFKPTYGRISLRGVFPLAWSLDTVGILARSVEDAALLLQVMAGWDALDPLSSSEEVLKYWDALIEPPRAPRLGLVRDFFWERATPEVWAHTETIVQRLAKSGASVEEIHLPENFLRNQEAGDLTLRAECATFHRDNFLSNREQYAPNLREAIEVGLRITAVEYVEAQRVRMAFCQEVPHILRNVDALLTPATPSAAPRDLTTTGEKAFQAPWTTSGLPAISLPTGLDAGAMPLGVQLVGSWFKEVDLLNVARWCEQVLGVVMAPPLD